MEKELTQTQYTLNRGAFLRAGHAGQIARNADKDRARIQEKLDDMRTKLAALGGSGPEPAPPPVEAENPKSKTAAKTAVKKK
ncbi:hypothetical protein HZB60_08315 [candidate division KSB1 bacterium]|nr:hypothetical protein [candidate division KSB1 bacterium]